MADRVDRGRKVWCFRVGIIIVWRLNFDREGRLSRGRSGGSVFYFPSLRRFNLKNGVAFLADNCQNSPQLSSNR